MLLKPINFFLDIAIAMNKTDCALSQNLNCPE